MADRRHGAAEVVGAHPGADGEGAGGLGGGGLGAEAGSVGAVDGGGGGEGGAGGGVGAEGHAAFGPGVRAPCGLLGTRGAGRLVELPARDRSGGTGDADRVVGGDAAVPDGVERLDLQGHRARLGRRQTHRHRLAGLLRPEGHLLPVGESVGVRGHVRRGGGEGEGGVAAQGVHRVGTVEREVRRGDLGRGRRMDVLGVQAPALLCRVAPRAVPLGVLGPYAPAGCALRNGVRDRPGELRSAGLGRGLQAQAARRAGALREPADLELGADPVAVRVGQRGAKSRGDAYLGRRGRVAGTAPRGQVGR
ncbi:hypothetical protein SFR_5225 [Streptomyces sp. FR-008]|nr:hypothetical protein SFR_5225 [Streptomyces sp. FR-008]